MVEIMEIKKGVQKKMTFIERPHENEKTRALVYVSKLLEEARFCCKVLNKE